jgi:hypothetical protein
LDPFSAAARATSSTVSCEVLGPKSTVVVISLGTISKGMYLVVTGAAMAFWVSKAVITIVKYVNCILEGWLLKAGLWHDDEQEYWPRGARLFILMSSDTETMVPEKWNWVE